MNNLFKIFLIFNLFSSTASSVNNYSQPLPENEFKMGQNVSEIGEEGRRKLYFPYLHSGMKVTGFTPGARGELYQRDCTLSFPVSINNDKGFLTSHICASSSVFVGDTQVGHVSTAYNFEPELGLEYAFVSVYDDYWSDEFSRGMTYSQCDIAGDTNNFIPLIPTPSQPLLNSTVYAYGGASGSVQGKIVEFNATIRTEVPGAPPSEPPVVFSNVVKVLMDKPYSPDDLGTPVYLTLQVPDSVQFIADPVGQVVENFDSEEDNNNIWYYIPLDRILNDSKLIIASGDLSFLLPPNNTESSNDFLADDLATNSNVSDINNLVSRQPNQPQAVDVHAGFRAWIFKSFNGRQIPLNGNIAKQCTLGFAVRKVSGRSQFDHGFLTLGSCMHSDREVATNYAFSIPNQNWVREEATHIGTIASLKYDPANGLNYAILRLRPNDAQHTLWDDEVSADMIVNNPGELEMVAVSNQPYPQSGLTARQELCWWGSSSGHMCGTIEHPSTTLTKLNPWRWPIYLEVVVPLVIAGQEIPLGLQWSPEDTFQNLIKVRLDEAHQPSAGDDSKRDYGAPVYLPHFNNPGLILDVRPVGILLDYDLVVENRNNQCVRVWYMYCLSVDRIISDSRSTGNELQLIGENIG